jgi:hypothetical protein
MPQHPDTGLTRSWLDDRLGHFDAANEALVSQTRSLLERVVANDAQHARLVNTLSMLEHMGSHKIMATQRSAEIDQPTLRHLAEEAHHAFFMKRQAEKIAGRPLEYGAQDLLAPTTARFYFQRLEAEMKRALAQRSSERAIYLYMSMVIEFRALWFYGLYQRTLQRAHHAFSLKRVIGEERNHLAEMAARLNAAGELSDARTSEFLERERALFTRLLAGLQTSIAA